MNGTIIKTALRSDGTAVSAVVLLIALPIITSALFLHSQPWQLMWTLAFSIYAGLKWLTVGTCPSVHPASSARVLAYLVLWPGMNANQFLDPKLHVERPALSERLLAISNLALGMFLLFVGVPLVIEQHPLVAGWIGMAGLVFVLHFGLFHVLSLCWRQNGINAEPIMNFPVFASSLSEFWGKRWNLAFRDLAFGHIFRPIVRYIGVAGATMAVFVVSGLVHDLVISAPVQGGWGRPTLYFTLQGVGLLIEHSRLGKQLDLRRGFAGRLFCGLFTVAPAGFLFHPQFVLHAILPTLAAFGAI